MTTATPSGTAPVSEHEVVVVGARCAGAATAMLLARQGHDVALVDRATFPSDTLSTHAIARGGVVQLARWGLLDAVMASGAPAIRVVSFHQPTGTLTRAVKVHAGADHLVAPRRTVLDAILLDAAVDAGVRFEPGVDVVQTLTDRRGRTTGIQARGPDRSREIHARLVVGADGVRSRIARSVGARVEDRRGADGATHYAYVAGLDAEGFEFHVAEGRFAGVFPTHGGEANVWICSPADAARLDRRHRVDDFLDLLGEASPSLAERVRNARITSPVRGAVRFPNQVLQAAGAGWALVGDAAYHRDPITGHGITDAFRDAELLARHAGSFLRGEVPEGAALGTYEAERHAALAPIFEITCRLAEFPPVAEFVALQKQLSRLSDDEAAWLASWPELTDPRRLVAA